MSEPQMCDFTDWHSEHDFTWDGLNVRHCPGRYAIIPLKPRAAPGSSVPEAARAAATCCDLHDSDSGPCRESDVFCCDRCPRINGLPDAAIDAAMRTLPPWAQSSVDQQMVIHVLESAAPHIVAAASVELQQEVDRLSAECEALRQTVAEERATTGRRIEAMPPKTWRDAPSGVSGMSDWAWGYAACLDDVRAALASPGEGE